MKRPDSTTGTKSQWRWRRPTTFAGWRDRGGGGPVPAGKLAGSPSKPARGTAEGAADAGNRAGQARLAKAETPADIAELVGIDPRPATSGNEGRGANQVRGRLTEEDQAVLDQAKANYDNAVAYGKALEAAVACVK